jgi:hypothetical protein
VCSASKSYGTDPGNSRTVAHTCFYLFTVFDVFPFPTNLDILSFQRLPISYFPLHSLRRLTLIDTPTTANTRPLRLVAQRNLNPPEQTLTIPIAMSQPPRPSHPTNGDANPVATGDRGVDIPTSLDSTNRVSSRSSAKPSARGGPTTGGISSREECIRQKNPGSDTPPSASTSTPGEEETLRDGSCTVCFDGPDDPLDPLNWPFTKKWGMVLLISAITFLTPLASSMFAPSVPEVMEEFGSTDDMLRGFMVSVYVLGFALGPLGMRVLRRRLVCAVFADVGSRRAVV